MIPSPCALMIGRGVDNLITDKPALARSVLQQRAELSVPERLLIGVASLLGSPPPTRRAMRTGVINALLARRNDS